SCHLRPARLATLREVTAAYPSSNMRASAASSNTVRFFASGAPIRRGDAIPDLREADLEVDSDILVRPVTATPDRVPSPTSSTVEERVGRVLRWHRGDAMLSYSCPRTLLSLFA